MMQEVRSVTIFRHSRVPLLLGLLLLLVLLQAWHELRSSGIEIERLQLSDSYKTPATRYTPAAEKRNGVVAILVHGYQCNRAMMAQLARYLAVGGVDVFAIDLPGHGASQGTFSSEKAMAAAEFAVADIIERSNVRGRKLVLIGHSLGATVLGPVASRREVLATVFIGPGKTDGLNRQLPNNALIITAENDYDFIKQAAQAMYDKLVAGDKKPPGNLVGDFQQNNARLWEEMPDVEHVSLIFDQNVYRLVADWIERSTRRTVSVKNPYSINPALRAAMAALVLSLVLAVLVSKHFSRPGKAAIHNAAGSCVRPAIAIVTGLYVAVVVTRETVALQFLHLHEGEILASLLAATGILGLGFMLALDEKISWCFTARDLIVVVLSFLSLYFLALLTIDGEFYSLRAALGNWNRVMALGITAVLAVPFFVLQEELLQRLQRGSGGEFRAFVISCGGSLLLAAMFCLSMYFVGFRLYRFNAALAGVLIYCAVASALLRARLKNTSAGVLVSSLVTGWIISVGFLQY